MSENGLSGSIDQEPSLSHNADQPSDVVAHVGAVVPRSESIDDLIERALSVAQLEYLRRSAIEPHSPLGKQHQVLLADLVIPQSRAGHEAGTGQGPASDGRVPPCSMASS